MLRSLFAITLLSFKVIFAYITGRILSCYCLSRLLWHLSYICPVILLSLRALNSESFCWPSWSMQSWLVTGQTDSPSLRWGNKRASFISAILYGWAGKSLTNFCFCTISECLILMLYWGSRRHRGYLIAWNK